MLHKFSLNLHGLAVDAEWTECPVRAALWGFLADCVDLFRR